MLSSMDTARTFFDFHVRGGRIFFCETLLLAFVARSSAISDEHAKFEFEIVAVAKNVIFWWKKWASTQSCEKRCVTICMNVQSQKSFIRSNFPKVKKTPKVFGLSCLGTLFVFPNFLFVSLIHQNMFLTVVKPLPNTRSSL